MNELTLFDRQKEIVSKIHYDGNMVSLTDLWKEAGSIREKAPNFWVNQDSTQQLIETVASILNAIQNCIIKTKKGKGGGTYAHKNIALAYAKYLDPKLHVLVNEVFFQRVEESKNPDLIAERYIKTQKRKGKSDEWIKERFDGKLARTGFTHILSEHGVNGKGYKNCTNAIYQPLFGGGAVAVRKKYGITKTQSIRDNLTKTQLAAIKFSETLAGDDIETHNLTGNTQCETASLMASDAVSRALIAHRKKYLH